MQNYNFIQKFLHDFYLGNKFIKKSLYEIEKIIFLEKKNDETRTKNHLFITGLPRSGTTALLNFFYKSNQFASLTYENMPFIMAINFCSKIFTKSNYKKKERFHQDGIFYDLKSPEALDEVFFSTFSNNEIKQELINFISLILINKNKKRYLSKNNLNFKRIELLQEILIDSIFLIPFREPLQHAYSLLNQHNHFIKLQNQDDFIRRYMNYLGHNEFGKNHKSWNIPRNYKNFIDLNYWLEQWLLFYQHVFEKYKQNKNCYFICYENLNNNNYVGELFKKVHLKEKVDFQFKVSQNKIDNDFNEDLYLEAVKIYDKIKSNLT
jgi:hypothetical protein